MKPSLCIDARMLFSSGIGTYIRNIIPYIEPFFQITLLAKKTEIERVKKFYSCHVVGINSSIYSFKEHFVLPYKIPKVDLFWSPHYNIPLLPIRAKKRIVTIHDVCHLAMPEFFSKLKRPIVRFLIKQAVKRSDLIFTVSSFSLQEMVKFLCLEEKEKNKVKVVYSGVEKKRYSDKISLEERNLKAPFVLYVGNLKPHKNIKRLLEAFLLLPSTYELVLAGRNFMDEALFSHPRIKLLGEVDDEVLSSLYQKAKVLVQPSLYEGFGLTPLEAMQAGCPVVSSPKGGLVEASRGAAFYINPLDVSSLAEGIKEVLENAQLRSRLIQSGFQRVEEASWEKTGNTIKDLLLQEAFS